MTASFDCDDDELYQIEYWFNVQGSVASGDFIAIGACVAPAWIHHEVSNITHLHCRYIITNSFHGFVVFVLMPGHPILEVPTGAYDDCAQIYSPYTHSVPIIAGHV